MILYYFITYSITCWFVGLQIKTNRQRKTNKPWLSFNKATISVVVVLWSHSYTLGLTGVGWHPSDRFGDTKRNRKRRTRSQICSQPRHSPLPLPRQTDCCLAPGSVCSKIHFTVGRKKNVWVMFSDVFMVTEMTLKYLPEASVLHSTLGHVNYKSLNA